MTVKILGFSIKTLARRYYHYHRPWPTYNPAPIAPAAASSYSGAPCGFTLYPCYNL